MGHPPIPIAISWIFNHFFFFFLSLFACAGCAAAAAATSQGKCVDIYCFGFPPAFGKGTFLDNTLYWIHYDLRGWIYRKTGQQPDRRTLMQHIARKPAKRDTYIHGYKVPIVCNVYRKSRTERLCCCCCCWWRALAATQEPNGYKLVEGKKKQQTCWRFDDWQPHIVFDPFVGGCRAHTAQISF